MRASKLRPEVGTVTDSREDECSSQKTVVTKVVETDAHVTIHYSTHTVYKPEGMKKYHWLEGKTEDTHTSTERHQKYLCVNGPRCGKRLVPEEAPGYVVFNRSSRLSYNHTRKRTEENIDIPSAILVLRSSLK